MRRLSRPCLLPGHLNRQADNHSGSRRHPIGQKWLHACRGTCRRLVSVVNQYFKVSSSNWYRPLYNINEGKKLPKATFRWATVPNHESCYLDQHNVLPRISASTEGTKVVPQVYSTWLIVSWEALSYHYHTIEKDNILPDFVDSIWWTTHYSTSEMSYGTSSFNR